MLIGTLIAVGYLGPLFGTLVYLHEKNPGGVKQHPVLLILWALFWPIGLIGVATYALFEKLE